MEVQGLDRLRQTSKQFSGRLDMQLRPAVRETAQEVRDRARNKARAFSIGGFYPASIRHSIESGGLVAFVGSIAKTALSIEQGRHAGEVVRFGLILRWVRRRGLARSVAIATRRVRKPSAKDLRDVTSSEVALARGVVAGIRARGTNPLPHLVPAAQESKDGWQRRVRRSVQTALQTVRGI